MAETARAAKDNVGSSSDLGGKYLTFTLADVEYGIAILRIKEIIGMLPVTAVARTPAHVKGVINLRGKVIPIMDLRLLFEMPEIEYTEGTCIIVIEALDAAMDKCWEVKKCNKTGCPAHESLDLRCWMISGTFCRDEIQGSYHEKIEACRKCDFYQDSRRRKTVITIGLVVDSVCEVLNIKSTDIEEAPSFGSGLDRNFICGIAKMKGGVKILLDIDRVLRTKGQAVAPQSDRN